MRQADISTKSKEKTGSKATSRKGIWSGAIFDLVLASTPVFFRNSCLKLSKLPGLTTILDLHLRNIILSARKNHDLNLTTDCYEHGSGAVQLKPILVQLALGMVRKEQKLKKLNLQSQTEPLQSKISAIAANPQLGTLQKQKRNTCFSLEIVSCMLCFQGTIVFNFSKPPSICNLISRPRKGLIFVDQRRCHPPTTRWNLPTRKNSYRSIAMLSSRTAPLRYGVRHQYSFSFW